MPDRRPEDPSHPGAPSPSGTGASFLPARLARGLVDLSFRRSIVADGAGALYVLWVALVLLHWLVWIALSALVGLSSDPSAYWASTPRAPWLPVLAVLLGWVPTLLAIVAGRAALELTTASVRSARDAERTADLLEALIARTAATGSRDARVGADPLARHDPVAPRS